METVTISLKFQAVIPWRIRKSLHLKAGQKMQMINFESQVVMVPLRSIKKMRGAFKGMNTNFERETDEAVAQVRAARKSLCDRFDNDSRRLLAHLRAGQRNYHGRVIKNWSALAPAAALRETPPAKKRK